MNCLRLCLRIGSTIESHLWKIAVVALLFAVVNGVAGDFSRQRLKVTFKYKDGSIEAVRVQHRHTNRDPKSGRIEGKIQKLVRETNSIRVGPIAIKINQQTQFNNLTLVELASGHAIKVVGHLNSRGNFIAESIEKSDLDSGYYKILGQVKDSRQNPDGSLLLKILDLSVFVPENVYDRGMSLVRNPDDKRPDKQLTIPLFHHPLIIGGEFGTKSSYRNGFKLRENINDNVVKLNNEFQLEMFYRFSNYGSLFLEGKTFREADVYKPSGDRETKQAFERGEAWLYMGNLFGSGLGFQVGRINFRETREWWWDQDLDALRVFWNRQRFHAEIAFAQEMFKLSTIDKQIDPEHRDVLRTLGRISYLLSRMHQFDFFFMRQSDQSSNPRFGQLISAVDEDEIDADLFWAGARFSGTFDFDRTGSLNYWTDAAFVTGKETLFTFDELNNNVSIVRSKFRQNVSGWALDSGLSWETKLPLRPTFTFGYAIGSGDKNPNDNTDDSFRQTGLNDNNNKFNGVDRFLYYGELLRPELSNLQIVTASLGFEMFRSSSIEFIFHDYKQVQTSTFLRKSKLKAKPLGLSPDIGREMDIVVGLEEWRHIEIEMIGAFFQSGDAFGALSGNLASIFVFKMDYNF